MNAKQVQDWIDNGPPCLNCGERVPDAEVIASKKGVAFKGMCKSKVCRILPPGGNPFIFALGED